MPIEHKQDVLARLAAMAEAAGATDPRSLGDQLLVLMDGALMAVRLFGSNNSAQQVARAAQTLIDTHIIHERMATP